MKLLIINKSYAVEWFLGALGERSPPRAPRKISQLTNCQISQKLVIYFQDLPMHFQGDLEDLIIV
jgi:hypothetical protein